VLERLAARLGLIDQVASTGSATRLAGLALEAAQAGSHVSVLDDRTEAA